jgi:hypothetical protein
MAPNRGNGLSPSGLSTYLSCGRKYFHNKVAKTPKDPDADQNTDALDIGSAFHKCLENTKHVLDGFSFSDVKKVCAEHDITDEDTAALVMAMLGKYKKVHVKSGLKVVACELVVNTDDFYGIIDVVLMDEKTGDYWLADMKTAASFRPDIIPTLPMHQQLNLYAAHFVDVAAALELDPTKYRGCRYRITTKSKISRKSGEEVGAYIGRISKAVKSYDFIIPKEKMNPFEVYQSLKAAGEAIKRAEARIELFPRNFGNCQAYWRPCEFWSQCHGAQFSDMVNVGLEVICSD